MDIRALTVAALLFLVSIPRVVAGQTPDAARRELDRFTVQPGSCISVVDYVCQSAAD